MTSSVVSDNFETSTGAIPTLGGDSVTTRFCSAWVNFNGTSTVAIRDSYNVSSITDNGTGKYTVNLATAMPDANYSTCLYGGGTTSGSYSRLDNPATVSTTAYGPILTRNTSDANIDWLYVSLAFFGN